MDVTTQEAPEVIVSPEFLVQTALRALPGMYDKNQKRFCHEVHIRPDNGGAVVGPDLSYRYTVISLLGLSRVNTEHTKGFIDLRAAFSGLIEFMSEASPGDLGLLLWLNYRLEASEETKIVPAIKRYVDADGYRSLVTFELAWLIAGLSVYCAASGSVQSRLLNSIKSYLVDNRASESGLMYHTHLGFRRRFPNFATQIYSVHALSLCSRLCGDESAAHLALRIAETLQGLQRPNGGWPWIYDAERGTVVEPFEIYSVHQDGMAPMALRELQRAAGKDLSLTIDSGLRWLAGENELQTSMIDRNQAWIMRSIRRQRPWNQLNLLTNTALSLCGSRCGGWESERRLEINRTSRPYHMGWILEAWCGDDFEL